MRKVIIPVDFSENAMNAVTYACELFRHETCKLFILHAYEEEVFAEESILNKETLEERKKAVRQHAEQKLQDLKTQLLKSYDTTKHEIALVSAFGLLIDEVNDLAEREDADLIITSTRGITNDRKLTFGSNTLQIIKYVQCPVLSIPEHYRFSTPRHILFPSNFLLPYQQRELDLIGGIARSFSSHVHLLYASRSAAMSLRQEANKNAILDQLQEVKVKLHHEELEKTAAIEKMAESLKADLLVLVNSRHSYLENILYTSTIDKIGLHPKMPFLALQNFHRF
ncbi:universal stress protein [Salinimicrobium oceani]|uniref:Universal stress protein n=1 Tax=Salinimicrobium oceani TaxID=2722702 RepID=A0ABX1CYR7_9FLAO|nr:universal stress protein [Salinimicrobium oceani]NJW52529.1 universal stress protein [Salinimicrobium oceani]